MKIKNIKKTLKKPLKKPLLFLPGFLVIATMSGIFFNSELVLAQIRGFHNNEQNEEVAGINALMSAVAGNDITGVKFFSKAGRELVNQKNIGGATALHIACREKNFEIVKILIENGADVDAADNEGWTPLMRASLSGSQDIVSLLLSKNAQINKINFNGESAIIHASLAGCNECLNLIFKSSNLINLMESDLLKKQLSEAFIIAQNHDNQISQKILDDYLDKVVKMSVLAEIPNLKKTDGTKFKLVSFIKNPQITQQNPQFSTMLIRRDIEQKPPITNKITKKFNFASSQVNLQKKVQLISGNAAIKKSGKKKYRFGNIDSKSVKSVKKSVKGAVFKFSSKRAAKIVKYNFRLKSLT
jgi:ankyrin repeat protein